VGSIPTPGSLKAQFRALSTDGTSLEIGSSYVFVDEADEADEAGEP
jgi:hypothetical protein